MDDRKCVMGIFDQYNTAKALKNRLLEGDFEETDISVIFGDEFKAAGYATTFGPFLGTTTENLREKFVHLGFGMDFAREYEGYLKEGYSLVAVAVYEEQVEDMVDLFNEFFPADLQVSD